MKKYFIWGATAICLLFAFTKVYAVDEFVQQTQVGEVVLTKEACQLTFNEPTPLKYRAYATEEGKENHEGCWFMDEVPGNNGMIPVVAVFWPEYNSSYIYDVKTFSPREKKPHEGKF